MRIRDKVKKAASDKKWYDRKNADLEYVKLRNAKCREYRKNNPEKRKETALKWWRKNKEQEKLKREARRDENREEFQKKEYSKMIKHRYGVTIDYYHQVLEQQGGVCKICGKSRVIKGQRRMPLDHDHSNGEIRGILCTWCNKALGYFEDNIKSLESAIEYLKNSRTELGISAINKEHQRKKIKQQQATLQYDYSQT